jgi:hypothetical protein
MDGSRSRNAGPGTLPDFGVASIDGTGSTAREAGTGRLLNEPFRPAQC